MHTPWISDCGSKGNDDLFDCQSTPWNDKSYMVKSYWLFMDSWTDCWGCEYSTDYPHTMAYETKVEETIDENEIRCGIQDCFDCLLSLLII